MLPYMRVFTKSARYSAPRVITSMRYLLKHTNEP